MNIYSDVVLRLESFGVHVLSDNDFALQYAIDRAKEQILNDIHHAQMPDGLKHTFIDMAAGYYLADRKAFGQLGDGGADVTAAAVKQIKEGDVQVTFADDVQTPEQRLDALIHTLTHPDPAQLTRFRRLSW
ncbi:MAG: hypothetical protein IKR49_00105 [Clostridia bacterium]|nr:hypothetical protein [Clostridia bacterium]